MKSHKTTITALAALAALSGVVSAHAQSRVTPILRAEITYSNTGYSEQFAPKGYEAGPGLTAGVLIDKKHEVSLSTGFTKFEGKHEVVTGFAAFDQESEQIPVLLNYRFHYALDKAARYTVFAGPTVGFIHEKWTLTGYDLGAVVPELLGADSDSAWKLAYGGTVGLTAKLGKGWDISGSAQLLKVSSYKYVNHSGTATFDSSDVTRPSFVLSVGYSW